MNRLALIAGVVLTVIGGVEIVDPNLLYPPRTGDDYALFFASVASVLLGIFLIVIGLVLGSKYAGNPTRPQDKKLAKPCARVNR